MTGSAGGIEGAFREMKIRQGRADTGQPGPQPQDRAFVIGTDPDCDVRIADEYASNRHARVWQDQAGQAWIEDLGSTNGTWLRGGQVPGKRRVYGPTRIEPGVVVRIGRTDIPWQS